MDDIWEKESWETIKLALVENTNGSRLITTTRKLGVVTEAGDVYKLQPLAYDLSKKLFYTRIFGAKGKCPDNQLDEVSDKILKKCDGVPLAIITMASLLVGKSREEWIEVCNSVAFGDKDNTQVNETEWILSLSYYDLPPHLKTCLLYLSLFPEDYVINKNSLIWKWVAEGFIHKKQGTSFFEAGEGYLHELINRSMLQAVEFEENGTLYGCRVHDMVLDLLRDRAQKENFVTILKDGEGTLSSNRKLRRLSLQNRMVEQTHQDIDMDLRHVRSLVAFKIDFIIIEGLSLLHFEFLRVLVLESCPPFVDFLLGLEHLDNLIYLRYLKLSSRRYDYMLPDKIGALKFLQTLDVQVDLPSSVGLLNQLICLRAGSFRTVQSGVIGKLTSLEELQIRASDDTVGQFFNEDSSVSWTIWSMWRAPSFGSETRDEYRVAPPTILPHLQVLEFKVDVKRIIRDNGSCEDLGLEYLHSLQKVKVSFSCYDAFTDDVAAEELALKYAIEVHPNKPTLQIGFDCNYPMKRQPVARDSVTEEQENVGSSTADEDVSKLRGEGNPSSGSTLSDQLWRLARVT